MKPRYFEGAGPPPVHVSSIARRRKKGGSLVFRGPFKRDRKTTFDSERDLEEKLRILVEESVPFSVGVRIPGPADEVQLLMDSGALSRPPVEISWLGPGRWIVREIVEGQNEWQRVEDMGLLTNPLFDVESLQTKSSRKGALPKGALPKGAKHFYEDGR